MPSGAGNCLPWLRPADLQVRGRLREVGEVLLAPVDRVLQQRGRRAGRPRCARRARSREAFLAASSAAGSRERARRAPFARRPSPWSEPATAIQSVLLPPRRDRDRVVELAAGAVAERAVVAALGSEVPSLAAQTRARLRAAEVAARRGRPCRRRLESDATSAA